MSAFWAEALTTYSTACCDAGIVAELWRFHLVLANDAPFRGLNTATVLPIKEIVEAEKSGGASEALVLRLARVV
jgi:hypothetical protein